MDDDEDAGASAGEQAELWLECGDVLERHIASLVDALAECRRQQGRYAAGSAGERAVAQAVQRVTVDLGADNWHLMTDRRWPGTAKANIDLLLVGPPGVVVIDAKRWREPRVEHGSFWNGQAREDEALAKLRDQADAVAVALSQDGLAPSAVIPLLALAGRRQPLVHLQGVSVVGERDLQRALIRLPRRIEGDDVRRLVEVLDLACPRMTRRSRGASTAPPTPRDVARPLAGPEQQPELLSVDEVWRELVEAAAREPLESWMTWLHPAQSAIVSRTFGGPARIRGVSGTGKSVVALHRARQLARRPDARVLVTSFVRSLPAVQKNLFARLAPELGSRVEFTGLHAWALRMLRDRGEPISPVAPRGGRTAFHYVWTTMPDARTLEGIVGAEDYWWDEEAAVIRGRGLSTPEEYLSLTRVGRRTPLRESARATMWRLHEGYRQRLRALGEWDWADVIDAALASTLDRPVEPAYTSVIIDEVQDIPAQGLRLLHSLTGDNEDGLLLVGDGQQAVYAGGCTLAEAGISVPGARSLSLEVNYRNRSAVLAAAMAVVSDDAFDDLDGDPASGHRSVETARAGGAVREVRAPDETGLSAALVRDVLAAAANGVDLGATAVLVRTNREAARWRARLEAAGLAAELLAHYEGLPTPGIKVGTFQRAKGLEFVCVYIPHLDSAVPPQSGGENDDAYRERAELQRRQLFVAMTRACDGLWLGTLDPATARPFLAPRMPAPAAVTRSVV